MYIPQQCLGCHHYQWFSIGTYHLPSEQVKVLGRGGRIDDTHVHIHGCVCVCVCVCGCVCVCMWVVVGKLEEAF